MNDSKNADTEDGAEKRKDEDRAFFRKRAELHDRQKMFLLYIVAVFAALIGIALIQYVSLQFRIDNERLDVERYRLKIEEERLQITRDRKFERSVQEDKRSLESQVGLATVHDVLMQAKADPSKLQSVLQAASILIDSLVQGGEIAASEGNDIKKILIEKGIGGGIDEAIKIVDKLINKYLGLSDEDEKLTSVPSGVTVNVYCSAEQKKKAITTGPPKPKKNPCDGKSNGDVRAMP